MVGLNFQGLGTTMLREIDSSYMNIVRLSVKAVYRRDKAWLTYINYIVMGIE